jgi:hypothetical protein
MHDELRTLDQENRVDNAAKIRRFELRAAFRQRASVQKHTLKSVDLAFQIPKRSRNEFVAVLARRGEMPLHELNRSEDTVQRITDLVNDAFNIEAGI